MNDLNLVFVNKIVKFTKYGVSDLSSGSVLGLIMAIWQCGVVCDYSYVTHGGSTKISSHVESLEE